MGRGWRVPRELYRKTAVPGFLGIGYDAAFGGTPADLFTQIVVWEELNRSGSGGLVAGLGSLHIAIPPIFGDGHNRTKREVCSACAGW